MTLIEQSPLDLSIHCLNFHFTFVMVSTIVTSHPACQQPCHGFLALVPLSLDCAKPCYDYNSEPVDITCTEVIFLKKNKVREKYREAIDVHSVLGTDGTSSLPPQSPQTCFENTCQ